MQDLRQFTASASGQEWEQDDSDIVGDDWAGADGKAADVLLAAWRREDALEQMVELPFGEVPAVWQIGQQITDLAVHGWDVAEATGQSTGLDPESGSSPWTGTREPQAPVPRRRGRRPRLRPRDPGGRPRTPVGPAGGVLRPRPALSSREPGRAVAAAGGPRRDGPGLPAPFRSRSPCRPLLAARSQRRRVQATHRRVRHAFPDCRFDLDNLLGEGDRVAFTWTFTGTHTGNLGPVPPTGRQVTVTGVNVERIADGRVAEYWSSPDNLRMFQQLGLVPRSARRRSRASRPATGCGGRVDRACRVRSTPTASACDRRTR